MRGAFWGSLVLDRFWADCCGFYGVGLELLLDGLELFLDGEVDKLVFGGDAGEDATEVGGV